ncbi:MAG: cytochrome c-type biogenesis protein CcmH [Gammaproteobacteria bacterium]|nr:cytochrome c-type biogenesis protein CcmH [Gammaproteobacteria bacterium]
MAIVAAMSSPRAFSAIEAVQFDDPAVMERYKSIIEELRCLVCQNQTLADSDADLAKDLRRKTAEMLQEGNTDQEIYQYMRERYGDFVLYRPPFGISTAFIWLGPFALLLIAATALLVNIRRRQKEENLETENEGEQAQRIKVRELMENLPELSDSTDNKD